MYQHIQYSITLNVTVHICFRDVNIGFLGKPVIGFEKNGFKSIIGFTDLHKNIVLCEANNFMYYTL